VEKRGNVEMLFDRVCELVEGLVERPSRRLAEERLEIIEIEIQEGSFADGKEVRELGLPDGSLVIAIQPLSACTTRSYPTRELAFPKPVMVHQMRLGVCSRI